MSDEAGSPRKPAARPPPHRRAARRGPGALPDRAGRRAGRERRSASSCITGSAARSKASASARPTSPSSPTSSAAPSRGSDELDRLIAAALTPDWPLDAARNRAARDPARRRLRAAGLRRACRRAVVISEYLDIGHAFFAGKEPGLVNGVLDRAGAHAARRGARQEGSRWRRRISVSSRASPASSRRSRRRAALGLLDDVALIDGPPGEQYVLKTDAIVEGVHFLADDPPAQVAQKLLRVNLSDLAAKGATPVGYLLMTALAARRATRPGSRSSRPGSPPIRRAMASACSAAIPWRRPGPATLSVAAIGRVATGRAVLRSGARAGRSRLCLRHARRRGARGDGGQGRGARHRRWRAGDFLIDRLSPAAAAARARAAARRHSPRR